MQGGLTLIKCPIGSPSFRKESDLTEELEESIDQIEVLDPIEIS